MMSLTENAKAGWGPYWVIVFTKTLNLDLYILSFHEFLRCLKKLSGGWNVATSKSNKKKEINMT